MSVRIQPRTPTRVGVDAALEVGEASPALEGPAFEPTPGPWSPVQVEAPLAATSRALPVRPVPQSVQRETLERVLQRVDEEVAAGRTPVVMLDLDLATLAPISRIARALRRAGQAHRIPELEHPASGLLPGYTEAAWEHYVAQTGLAARYPEQDWTPTGAIYRTFRGEYWQGDLAEDVVSPGLVDFLAELSARGGKGVFTSGRSRMGNVDDSRTALNRGGVPESTELLLGQQTFEGRSGDAATKAFYARALEARGWVVVAVVDDRATNRQAVLDAVGEDVLSIAVAQPPFSWTEDAETSAMRIATFER